MSATYDVIVAGGGHNGLTVAGYLSRAGVNVAVVEAKERAGGGAITAEVNNPGFKHDLASTAHMWIQPNPLIARDELELQSKYGLKYLFPKSQSAIVFPDDRVLTFWKDVDATCQSIAQFSEKDAETYRRFHAWADEALALLLAGMFGPPPPFGAMVGMLDSSPMGQELLRALMSSAFDMANEWFESAHLRNALGRFISEAMVDPQLKGTGLNVVLFVALVHKYSWGVPEGGAGALSDALIRAIEDHGGTVLTSSVIKSFKVEDGECKGVVLESGEEILAKRAVVSTLNIKQIPDLVDPNGLPEEWARKARQVTPSSFSALHQCLDLNEVPAYRAGLSPDQSGFVQFVSDDTEQMTRVFDGYKYGVPYTDNSVGVCWTIIDPTRAPAGKHTLYLYHYAPYELKDGGASAWEERKARIADEVLSYFQSRTTNMGSENILGRWAASPLDLERFENGAFPRGDIMHIGMDLYQNLGNRPFMGQGQYRTPVKNMYIAGASTSPGGGIQGGGRAAMPPIMEDLGLDFGKLFG